MTQSTKSGEAEVNIEKRGMKKKEKKENIHRDQLQ